MISQIIIQTREQSHTNLVNDVHKYAAEKGTTVFKTSDFISHFALEVCAHDLHLCCVSKGPKLTTYFLNLNYQCESESVFVLEFTYVMNLW